MFPPLRRVIFEIVCLIEFDQKPLRTALLAPVAMCMIALDSAICAIECQMDSGFFSGLSFGRCQVVCISSVPHSFGKLPIRALWIWITLIREMLDNPDLPFCLAFGSGLHNFAIAIYMYSSVNDASMRTHDLEPKSLRNERHDFKYERSSSLILPTHPSSIKFVQLLPSFLSLSLPSTLSLRPSLPPSFPSSLALSPPHSYRQQNKHTSVFVRGQFDGDICLDEASQKSNQNVKKHMSKTKNVRKQLWMPKNELRGIVWKLFCQSLKLIGAMFEGSCHHHHFLFFYAADSNPSFVEILREPCWRLSCSVALTFLTI